jgi:hypothetical protein
MGNSQSEKFTSVNSAEIEKLQALFHRLTERHGSDTDVVTEPDFQDSFSGPGKEFGHLMFHHCLRATQEISIPNQLGKAEFVAAMLPVFKAVVDQSKSELFDVMFGIFSEGKKALTKQGSDQMVTECCILSLAASSTVDPDLLEETSIQQNTAIQSFQETLGGVLSSDDLADWLALNAPGLFDGIQSWLKETITCSNEFYTIPQLQGLSQNVVPSAGSLDYPLLWLLSTVLPHCYSSSNDKPSPSGSEVFVPCFSLLYDSQEQGHSFNRFEHHVFGYRGPTLLILTLEGGLMFLIASDTEWRDSPASWGDSNCLLVQVKPTWTVIDSGSKMLYYHLRSSGKHKGFQVGRDLDDPFISTCDLNEATYKLNKGHAQQSDVGIVSVEVCNTWICA